MSRLNREWNLESFTRIQDANELDSSDPFDSQLLFVHPACAEDYKNNMLHIRGQITRRKVGLVVSERDNLEGNGTRWGKKTKDSPWPAQDLRYKKGSIIKRPSYKSCSFLFFFLCFNLHLFHSPLLGPSVKSTQLVLSRLETVCPCRAALHRDV